MALSVGLARLGLLSFPTYFQCKRYDNSVGSGAVRDFPGAMAGRGEKGVILTTAMKHELGVRVRQRGFPPSKQVEDLLAA